MYLSGVLATLLIGLSIGFLPSAQALSTKAQQIGDLNPLIVEDVLVDFKSQNEASGPDLKPELILRLKLDDGFHAYREQFKLKLIGPPGFHASEIQIEPLVSFHDPISKKTKQGAEGVFALRSILEILEYPTSPTQIELALTYQACGKDFCLLPKTIPVTYKLSPQPTSETHLTNPDHFRSALAQGWLYALVFVFFAGILTSFTPCIFPMIPITLAVIGSKSEHSRWRGFLISLFYVLGIALTYSLLGLFAAKSGRLFGGYLGRPVVVFSIAGIFVLMALSMFGLFEIKAPQFVTRRLSNIHTQKNFWGSFLSGLIAGVVASPCVGPVLIGILTYVAQTQNPLKGFVLLFTFALGLGQIFLVLGTFHSFLHKIPRSGPWLNQVKKIFGVVMLAMAVYYVYPVAKRPVTDWLSQHFSLPSTPSEDFLKPNWQTYSDEELAKALRDKKGVIIDFNAEWCLACKELERYTFSDPRVLDLGKQFVWLTFDATEPSPEMDRLQQKYGIGGLPFVVIYNQKGQASRDLYLTGFEDADAFLTRMRKALDLGL